MLQSADGKRVQVELEAARAKVEDELAKDEAAVVKARGEPGRYQKLAAAYEAKVIAKQKALDEAQDQKFAPIIDRFVALLESESSAELKVVDSADHPPLFGDASCEVTAELVKIDAKKGHLSKRPGCAKKAIFYVSLDRVMASLPESKAASARLDAFTKEKQLELDERQRRGGSSDEHRFELAERYEAYRRALKEREAREQANMRTKALQHIQARSEGFDQALFLERIAEVPMLDRACDVTRFFSGEDRAPLGSTCPAWTGSAP